MSLPRRMICLGPAGAFSHQAALQFASQEPNTIAHPDLDIVFATRNEDILPRITSDPEAVGVIAVENSTAGFVLPVVLSWLEHHHANCSPIIARGELWLPIEHNLLVKPGTKIANITSVLSHPQALAQSGSYLTTLGIQTKEVASTALAAQMARDDETGQTAAVASTLAGEIYGLKVAKAAIQNNKRNRTHFLLLGRTEQPPTGDDRTVLMFRLLNEAGSLERLLHSFSSRKINLSHIESIREGDGNRSSLFYVEADSHIASHDGLRDELVAKTTELIIMGSFPKAD